jgi:undecaprenyl-diphosphatase
VGVFLAATRVAALAHWPSDVIAGFSIGIGTALLVARHLASRELFFRLSPGKILPETSWLTPQK